MRIKKTLRHWIEVDPALYFDSPRNWEDAAEDLEELLKEHDAFSKHRVTLEREEFDVCSFCGCDWEVDEEGTPVCCEKAVAEHEAEEERKRKAIAVVGSL